MKMWKRLLMAICLCAIWSFTALAAEDDPVKIERVKLKFESFRPKDGYVKITNLGTGYSVGDCEIINDSDIDNWNSSYCARLQIELTADDGYEFRKKGKSYFDLKGSDFYRYESSDYDDKEVIWLCVDMAPLNRSICVPLDPVWTADGTAKWTVAYKADSYNITLMENGKKKKSESVKRCSVDFSASMEQGKEYTFSVLAVNSKGSKSKAVQSETLVYAGNSAADGNSQTEQSGGWMKEESTGRWRYGSAEKSEWCTNAWKLVNGIWYRFDKDGYMITGWYQDAGTGRWYYLDASGAMVTGERKIDGMTYRFAEGPADMAGVMLQ